ncbi:hypothetical protein BW730_16940 [Tessaracoccus aquimaris]|uniref:Uncharacterized protein n=1 Tax=Tessaracoccus aquimaris TaxID=1332264 RepID=A0A1Q2CS51_9ACTN|nr:hypothetical protein [Tessaracoccus aquimaris]AQP48932.1 hypothetical protein BW730_16940 [Tessaracoccus aquimaris]
MGASGDVYGNVDAGDFYANEFVGPDRAGLTCAPDTYYALTNDGQLKVVSGTSVTNVGNKAPGVTRFNGLGIGAGGGRVYAYEQSANSTSVTMWYFDGLNWHPTTNTFSSSAGAYFIAGDVNPSDQAYYFGGYVGSRFYIDKFVPETGVTSRVGWVELGMSGSFNGDIAFDAAGNLFILRSSTADGTTTLFSVTAAVLAAVTNGGDRQMPTSQSFTQKLTGFVGVNGIAFNSTGGIYLGTQTIARQYHPATWEKVGGDAAVGGASPASSGDPRQLQRAADPECQEGHQEPQLPQRPVRAQHLPQRHRGQHRRHQRNDARGAGRPGGPAPRDRRGEVPGRRGNDPRIARNPRRLHAQPRLRGS